MEYRGKITVHEIALSYCQPVKNGSHTARLVFTQRYFSYRFPYFLFRGISPLVKEPGFLNPGKFCLWNLESGIQLKESGIPLTKTGINYL